MPDKQQRVKVAFDQIFGRLPDQEEMATALQFLDRHDNQSGEANSHLIWAMLSSAEFRFNH